MDDKLKLLTEKKKQLDALRPLPKELEQNLEDWFRVELTYTSNAIEGNTLSRMETAEVLERGITAVIPGKPLKDQLEALNHAKALGHIKTLAKALKSHQYITEGKIKALHKVVLTGIDDKWAGVYRQTLVVIRGAEVELPDPHKVPYLMNEFVQWLERQQEKHPVKLAADAHLKLVSIHPFVDGNGRTARLLMNLILTLNGYPMTVIRTEERTRYLDALNTAQTKGNIEPFYNLIETSVERSLDIYLRAARGEPVFHERVSSSAGQIDLKKSAPKLLKIGELAKETGKTIHTLHYWTEEGLLEVKERTPGGYALYDPRMIERVKEIGRMQGTERLTIAEIKHRLGVTQLTGK